LKRKETIKRGIAFLLLLVFMVSMTPKSYLHDSIATHKDFTYCRHQHKVSACLHQQGFNCHFDNLVVTAPYIAYSPLFSFHLAVPYISFIADNATAYYCHFFFHTDSRGPPACLS